jgi:hypothetical protein
MRQIAAAADGNVGDVGPPVLTPRSEGRKPARPIGARAAATPTNRWL